MIKRCSRKWIVTYDVHSLITELYAGFRHDYLDLNYSINQKRRAKEYIFFSNNISLPANIKSFDLTSKNLVRSGAQTL
jgi:DNA adenine methylase